MALTLGIITGIVLGIAAELHPRQHTTTPKRLRVLAGLLSSGICLASIVYRASLI